MNYRTYYTVDTETGIVSEYETERERDEYMEDDPQLRKAKRTDNSVRRHLHSTMRAGAVHD